MHIQTKTYWLECYLNRTEASQTPFRSTARRVFSLNVRASPRCLSALQTLEVIFLFAVSRLKCSQTLEVLVANVLDAAISVFTLPRDAIVHVRLSADIVIKCDASLCWKNTSGNNSRQFLLLIFVDESVQHLSSFCTAQEPNEAWKTEYFASCRSSSLSFTCTETAAKTASPGEVSDYIYLQLKTTELVTLSALRLLRGRRWIRAESDGELDFWPLTLTSVRSVCDPQSSGSQSQLKDVLIHIWSTLTIRRYSLMPRNIFGGSLCCTLCVLKPFAPSAFPTVTCWIKYPPPWRISD